MKREDFEELVRLLRGWLKVAESRNQEAELAHSKLVEWAELHSRDDVQKASDAIALRSGFDIEQQGHSRWVMEIGRPGGKTFFSAIDAIDYLLRQASETDFESAIDATTKPLYPWTRIQLPEIDRSLVALRARLGEELKHLEHRADGDQIGDGKPKLTEEKKRELRQKTFKSLAALNRINKESSSADVEKAAALLVEEFPGEYLGFCRQIANNFLNDKWPDREKRKSK